MKNTSCYNTHTHLLTSRQGSHVSEAGHLFSSTRTKALRPPSFKHILKLSLVLLISVSFILQTNATKPLAETLDASDTPSTLADTLTAAEDFVQEMLSGVVEQTSQDLSHSATSESVLSSETPTTNTLGAAFAWDPDTRVLTIQGDCAASEIKSEITNEASTAQEVCFSGNITITTDQGASSNSSPFYAARNTLKSVTATEGAHVSFAAADGATNPTLQFFFNNCSSLTSLDALASWDVSNVTGALCMHFMFSGCSSLTSLDGLSAWDVSNVTGGDCMEGMFKGCSDLTSIDALSAWNVSKVEGNYCMYCMFYGCTSLQDITGIASWNLTKAKASSGGVGGMFRNCPNITYIKGAPTDAEGFVPSTDMNIQALSSSNHLYSETAPETPVAGNTLLDNWSTYAAQGIWTWKQTVTFNANGGQDAPGSELVAHNSFATQPTTDQNPTKSGFYFAGWATDTAGTALFDFAGSKISSDTTLYAKWSTIPTYSVSFETGGGSQVNAQYIKENQTATRPTEDPTRTGYTFVNWYTDETGTTLFNFATPITANTVVYAAWSVNSYTATFDAAGGSPAPAAQTVEYGKTLSVPQRPQKAGFYFAGWYRGATKWNFAEDTMPAQDITLYAHWSEAPVPEPITVDTTTTNGRIVVQQTEATEGQRVDFQAIPDAGYVVQGLPRVTTTDELQLSRTQGAEALEVIDDGNNNYHFIMPAAPVTISAVFEKVPGPTPTPEPLPVPLPTPSEDPTGEGLSPEQQEEIVQGIQDILDGKVDLSETDPYIRYLYETYVAPYLEGKIPLSSLPQFLQDYFCQHGILPQTGDSISTALPLFISFAGIALSAVYVVLKRKEC